MEGIEYFLKIDGIEGESQDRHHKGELEVVSWSWGESQTIITSGGGGSTAGKVAMRDLQATMNVSKAAPALFLACASGKHFANATLTCRKKDGHDFLVITMSNVLVSTYEITGAAQGPPLDQLSLCYAKIKIEYREQQADGSLGLPIKSGWDVAANTPV